MLIGLTGRIAGGKGVISDFFKENGFEYLIFISRSKRRS